MATTALRASSFFCPAAAAASPRAVPCPCPCMTVGQPIDRSLEPSTTSLAHTTTQHRTNDPPARQYAPRRSWVSFSFRFTSLATGSSTPLSETTWNEWGK